MALVQIPSLQPFNNFVPTGRSVYVRTPSTTYANQNSLGANFTWYSPVFLPTGTIDRLSFVTVSAFSGTASVRLGIYNNGANNLPTTVLLDAGTVSATAASTIYEITVSQSISAGLYWLAFNSQTAATTNSYGGGSTTNSLLSYTTTVGNLTTAMVNGYSQSGVTGAFATAGTLTEALGVPWVYARVA